MPRPFQQDAIYNDGKIKVLFTSFRQFHSEWTTRSLWELNGECYTADAPRVGDTVDIIEGPQISKYIAGPYVVVRISLKSQIMGMCDIELQSVEWWAGK